jgi:FKBP-type peptidyl-prolyl cis-trans isomerase FkpA
VTLARFFRCTSFILLSALVLGGCEASPAAPAANAPYSQTDLKVGPGIAAENGKRLSVLYTGWIYDPSKTDSKGIVFDTSGTKPFEFTLGAGDVIEGWDKGLLGMKVGGLRKLIIPPSLGYGGNRQGPIPPNTGLVFEVELLEVKDPS